jgi:hypothetical protein
VLANETVVVWEIQYIFGNFGDDSCLLGLVRAR